MTWDDLLQEAITRVLVGSRRQPQGVMMVALLAGIMRSLRAEHWRRARQGPGSSDTLRIDQQCDLSKVPALRDPTPDPERSLMAREELGAIERLFADDRIALRIIAGLAEGRSAAQIRAAANLDAEIIDRDAR